MVEFNGNVLLISGTPFLTSFLILAKKVFVNLLVTHQRRRGRCLMSPGLLWELFSTLVSLQCVCCLKKKKKMHFVFPCFFTLLCTSLHVRVHGLEPSETWPVHYQLKPEITEHLLWFKVASLRSDFEDTVLNSSIF